MSKVKRIFMDLHVLQSIPPSNVNRDDTGSPKSAQYGGVQRARVSSQAWKKAMRDYFRNEGKNNAVGVRTLFISDYVASKIVSLDRHKDHDEALDLADKVLKIIELKVGADHKLKALYFLGDKQAEALAKAALEGVEDKKTLQAIIKANPPVDIALFGRMLADDPSQNEDASAQVAHAISTHAIQEEFDFYTALDDLSPEDNAGATMIGTVEFNSSTYYRYANVAVHSFYEQMNADTEATVDALKLFAKSFVLSMPSGKSNSFANLTLPQSVLIVLRADRPVNLVTAFEKAVRGGEKGFVEPSIKHLKKEYEIVGNFSDDPIASFAVGIDGVGIECSNLSELLSEAGNAIQNYLSE